MCEKCVQLEDIVLFGVSLTGLENFVSSSVCRMKLYPKE